MKSLALLHILVLTLLIPTLAAAQWSVVNDPGTFDGIEIFLPHEDGLYVGTFQGQVHASVDHGGTWSEVGSGLVEEYDPVTEMAIVDDWFVISRSASGNNYRCQHDGWFFKTGGTVTKWRAPHPATTSVAAAIAPAMQATLSARPNPFNPATRIDYTIAGAEHVRLTIHDPQGRLVAMLVDEPQAAGEHSVSWDARDAQGAYLSSGVYLVRLRAGSRIESDKLVLAR